MINAYLPLITEIASQAQLTSHFFLFILEQAAHFSSSHPTHYFLFLPKLFAEWKITSSYFIFLSTNILEILIVESLLISYSKNLTGDYLYRLETQYGSWKCSKLKIYLSQMPCISLFIKERLLNSVQGVT